MGKVTFVSLMFSWKGEGARRAVGEEVGMGMHERGNGRDEVILVGRVG